MQALRRRLAIAAIALLAVIGVGSVGYFLLGGGRWSLSDCVYMTVVTVSTVGYGEVLPEFHTVAHVRAFTIILIMLGTGMVLYFVSTFTALVVEGDLLQALRENRMQKALSKLSNHIIVCGAGSTGRHVVDELLAGGESVVAIDLLEERLEHLVEKHPNIVYVVGDANDESVLDKVGIQRAAGVVVALSSDKDNLFLTITAKQANPRARIVARGSDLRVLAKLRKAGADGVVSPNYIGGLRMVSELIRPKTLRFIDELGRMSGDIRLEELLVPPGSRLDGKSLGDAAFRRTTDLLVLAVREANSDHYRYNPGADFVVHPGMTLVVFGSTPQVKAFCTAFTCDPQSLTGASPATDSTD